MIPALVAIFLALPPIMPVDEIRPGDEGSCLTVFEGETIEPFSFVVKGVMRNFLGPGSDLVLVRLLGDKPEFTGVVAGMSGSPCSIDGRIVGALAYAFAAFAKEPIAGITPMAGMLETMKIPAERRPWRIGPSQPSRSASSDADWNDFRAGVAASDARADGLRRIATPLSLGGVLPRVRDHFSPWLESQGFVPVAAGVASGDGTVADIKPGGPVCAVLVSGDVDIAATGTVTSVEGKEVLAFGHPFLGVGAVSVPMATATILNTMASQQRSFKMSQTGAIVGEFTQDRMTAIGGFLGAAPKMVPVSGKVAGISGERTFRFDVARDFGLSPRFVAMGLSNALYGAVDVGERGLVRLTGTVRAKGLEPLVVRGVYAGQRDGGMLMNAAVDVARNFATLWSTPFGAPPEFEIAVDVVIEAEPVEEWIEAVHLDRPVAKPGEQVEVAVRLQREDGEPSVERFLLTVPRSWSGHKVDVIAASSAAADEVYEDLGGNPRPENLAQVRRWLAQRRLGGHLYLMVVRQGAGMRSEVDVHSFIPPSMVTILSGDPNKQRRSLGVAWEERRARPGVIYGGMSASLTVIPQTHP